MQLSDVYLGLGGNIGDSQAVVRQALGFVGRHACISSLKTSRLYMTTPVSLIPQARYVNAVCCFKTSLTAKELLHYLQFIEKQLGKIPKAKDAPRVIDLDILFFGKERHDDHQLCVPHPKWQERLFVLVPLAELLQKIGVPYQTSIRLVDVEKLIESFPNPHNETLIPLE